MLYFTKKGIVGPTPNATPIKLKDMSALDRARLKKMLTKPKRTRALTKLRGGPRGKEKAPRKLQQFKYDTTPLQGATPVNVAFDLPAVPREGDLLPTEGETFDISSGPRPERPPTERQLQSYEDLEREYTKKRGGIKEAKKRFLEVNGIEAPKREEMGPYIESLNKYRPAPSVEPGSDVYKQAREEYYATPSISGEKELARQKVRVGREAKAQQLADKAQVLRVKREKAKAQRAQKPVATKPRPTVETIAAARKAEERVNAEVAAERQRGVEQGIREANAAARSASELAERHSMAEAEVPEIESRARINKAFEGIASFKPTDEELVLRRDAEIDAKLAEQYRDGVEAEAYYADEARAYPLSQADLDLFEGNGLSGHHVDKFVKASYAKKKHSSVEGYELDRELSTKNNKVYRDPNGKVVVANAGTSSIADWLNNKNIFFGNYDKTARYREVEDVQKKAIEKYGLNNITNVGHSQSGEALRLLSKKGLTQDAIAVNPAIIGKPTEGLNVIRSSGDWVSAFTPTTGSDTVIPAKTFNPLVEHGSEIINQAHVERMFGKPEPVPPTGMGFNIRPFQAQFRVFKRLNPVKDLKEYAEYILEHPHEFQNVTFQRAVHYLKKT